jgi:hypothetical protein
MSLVLQKRDVGKTKRCAKGPPVCSFIVLRNRIKRFHQNLNLAGRSQMQLLYFATVLQNVPYFAVFQNGCKKQATDVQNSHLFRLFYCFAK